EPRRRDGLDASSASRGVGLRLRRLPRRTLAGPASADRPHQPVEDRGGARRRAPRRRRRGGHWSVADRPGAVAAAHHRSGGWARRAGGRPGRIPRQARRGAQGIWVPGARPWGRAGPDRFVPLRRAGARRLRAPDRRLRPVTGIVLLGSTGSIGRQTLEVVEAHRDEFSVVGLAAGRLSDEFGAQLAAWPAARAWCSEGRPGGLAAERWVAGGLEELATTEGGEIVVVATTGMAALPAVLAALRGG